MKSAARAYLLASAVLFGGGLASPALAQPAPAANAAQPNANSDQTNQEAIVVTAQKRAQVLIDVPQSVTVIGGAALERNQATNFQDYLKLVPGLQLAQSNPGEGRLVIRGLNTQGVASTVAVYVDETPFGSSTGLVNGAVLAGDFDTFDVNRIEVLRGPQGTLYGANSLGGLLKFVTNEPNTRAFVVRGRVGLEATKGGDLSTRAQAVINVPISNTIAFRASGSYRFDGGFIDSVGTSGTPALASGPITSDVRKNINDAKSYGGRASLLFKPSDVFSLRLSADLQNIRTDAPTIVESDPVTLEPLHGGLTQSTYIKPFGNLDYRVYNGLLNYDFGFATLTSSTSFSKQNQTRRQDVTFNLGGVVPFFMTLFGLTPIPGRDITLDQNTNDKKFTQEVRLASHQSDRFEWLVGGYYTKEDGFIRQQFIGFDPVTEVPTVYPPAFTPLALVTLASDYKEIAGFANGTIHFGERFHLDVGGRYSHNDQTAIQTTAGPLGGGSKVFPNLKSSDDVFTYSVAPRWEVSPNESLYARVAKGYRPGGPNALAPGAPPELASYRSDTTTNYELGFKGQTPNHRASLDVAVYHIDWNDVQLTQTINNFTVNANGGKAKVDGFELTGTVRPLAGLNLSANAAYTNARLAQDLPPVGGVVNAREGTQLPFTPHFSFALNGDYDWAVGPGAQAYIGASYRWLSRQTASYSAAFVTAHGHQLQVPAYGVFDVRGGVDFGRFSVEAYAKNLFDSQGVTSTVGPTANGFPLYPGGAIGTGRIRPRVVGISLTASNR